MDPEVVRRKRGSIKHRASFDDGEEGTPIVKANQGTAYKLPRRRRRYYRRRRSSDEETDS